MDFRDKYIKYKTKYIKKKYGLNQDGGFMDTICPILPAFIAHYICPAPAPLVKTDDAVAEIGTDLAEELPKPIEAKPIETQPIQQPQPQPKEINNNKVADTCEPNININIDDEGNLYV